MADARIIIWDPETGDDIERINANLRPVQSDTGDGIVLAVEVEEGQDFRYGGVRFCIEISPSAVRSEQTTAAILQVADQLRMPVA